MRLIADASFENISDGVFRKQAGIFREEAEDDAIEETRDAKVLALGDGMLSSRFRIDQLDGFALLQ